MLKGKLAFFFTAFAMCVGLTVHAQQVFSIRIQGTIDPATSDFLSTTLESAQEKQISVVLVELDTPGGLVSSVREMAQAIDRSPVPVIVWVTPAGASATSAGALLMLSAHVAAMAPGTNIGAAHPVGAEGKAIEGPMGDKVLNDVSAFARGLAELRGRNSALAEAVVRKSRSFTAEEALKERLIDLLATDEKSLLDSLEQFKVTIGGKEEVLHTKDASVQRVEMSWGQSLLHMLAHPNIAAILMTLGVLLIYIEVSNPGISVAGILGGLALILAFMSLQVLPLHTGGLLLLVLGLALLILEPIVGTGGIFAGGGVVSFVLGLLWFVDTQKTDISVSGLVIVGLGATLGVIASVITMATLRMKRLNRETLDRIGGGGEKSGLAGYVARVLDVEPGGVRGTVLIRGERWRFESSSVVREGEDVLVDRVQGLVAHVLHKTEFDKEKR